MLWTMKSSMVNRYAFFLPNVFIVKRKERKRKGRRSYIHEEKSQNYFFDIYIYISSTNSSFGAWSLHLVNVRLTPSQGPKAFKNAIFRNWTMEV